MDGKRFDDLARTLTVTGTASRRTTLKALAAAAAGLGLRDAGATAQTVAPAVNNCRASTSNCDRDKQCCSKLCNNDTGKCDFAAVKKQCKGDTGCGSGRCDGKKCVCASRNGQCVEDKDCCSRRCQLAGGKIGSCECGKKNDRCREDGDCCGGLGCKNRKCKKN